MRFIQELKNLRLYSASKVFYSPVDAKNKKKGAAIFMLTPNIESSEWVMQLPYMHNPNNFNSYYISRDVTAYIDSKDNIDEDGESVSEEAIIEGLTFFNDKILTLNFNGYYDPYTEKIVRDLFNLNFKKYTKLLRLKDVPGDIDIYIYKDYDEFYRTYKKAKEYKIHSFSTPTAIHIIGKDKYNGLDGSFQQYVSHEIASVVIKNVNPKCHHKIESYVAGYMSGQIYNDTIMGHLDRVDATGIKVVERIVLNEGYRPIIEMIKKNDPSILYKYGWNGILDKVINLLGITNEAALSSKERNELPDSEFGVPSKRAYPLNDESHVRSAIKMFNHVDEKDESQLASRIISKMKKFGIKDISVSKANRFYPYYIKAFPESKKESCMAPIVDNEELKLNKYAFGEGYLRIHTEDTNLVAFYENTDDSSHDAKLRRYLYRERIKNNKEQIMIYNEIKSSVPFIKRTFLKIPQYLGYNLFVDLHYYNKIFLSNNILKMDKAVEMYWDFMNRLMNNEEINSTYGTRTYMIPIHGWTATDDMNTITDYKKSINPISVIFRLLRTNPDALKREWGNKTILFVGKRGYFKIDFSSFELKHAARVKNHLRKLLSTDEPIIDDEDPDTDRSDVDTKVAIAASISDKLSDANVAADVIAPPMSSLTSDTTEEVTDFVFYNRTPSINNAEDKKTNVYIMSPHLDSTLTTLDRKINNSAGIKTFIRLKKKR